MKASRGEWLVAVLVLVCAVGIAVIQRPLAAKHKAYSRRDDILMLPPPDQLRAMTLGYRATGADLLWAKLIVEHGLHHEEKRAFPDMPTYIDGILELDPAHPIIYDFVDVLILYSPVEGTATEARLARQYFERGIRERPYDSQVWLRYGQFMAFLAPSFLKDQAEIDQGKQDGARAITHAVELGAVPDRALAATSILSRAGERKAAIAHLQRTYALTDDYETRRQIKGKLAQLEATVEAETAIAAVEEQWRDHFPLVSRGTTLLLGPHRDPRLCAGTDASSKKACPENWTEATRDVR